MCIYIYTHVYYMTVSNVFDLDKVYVRYHFLSLEIWQGDFITCFELREPHQLTMHMRS